MKIFISVYMDFNDGRNIKCQMAQVEKTRCFDLCYQLFISNKFMLFFQLAPSITWKFDNFMGTADF